MARRGGIASRGALGVAIGAYLALGLYQLELPGFHYDEAFDALPALEMLAGKTPSAAMSVSLFGREWPVMLHPHIGPTSTYVSLLAFRIGGASVEAVRAAHLAIGAVTLVLLWSLGRRWFGDPAAAAAVILCATAPAFVWWNRAGANWSSTLLPLALGLVLVLHRWHASRSAIALAVAAFLFGAGLATKINFLWLCAPIALTALAVLGPRECAGELRRLTAREHMMAIGAFVAGALPLVIYNLATLGGTARFVAGNALRTKSGHDNLAFLHNVSFLVRDFTSVMGGSTGEFPSPSGGRFAGIVFVASAVLMSVLCLARWLRGSLRVPRVAAAMFLVLMVVTFLTIGTATTSHVGARHIFMLVPFAWLLVAVAAVDTASALRHRLESRGSAAVAAAVVPYAVLALVVSGHVSDHLRIHRFLAATGGHGVWSSAISTLAERLQTTYASRVPVVMDWGLMRNLAFLTGTRVTAEEAFEYEPRPTAAFRREADTFVRNPRNVYIFHAPGFTAFPGYREALDAAASAAGKQLRLLETLSQRDGTPNILVYDVADRGIAADAMLTPTGFQPASSRPRNG